MKNRFQDMRQNYEPEKSLGIAAKIVAQTVAGLAAMYILTIFIASL